MSRKKRIGMYSILVVIVAFYTISFYEPFPVILLAVLLALPSLSYISLSYYTKRIKLQGLKMASQAIVDRSSNVVVILKNNSRISLQNAIIHLRISYKQGDCVEYMKSPIALKAKRKIEITIPFILSNVGEVAIEIEGVTIRDLFNIFERTINIHKGKRIIVYPKEFEAMIEHNMQSISLYGDEEEYSSTTPGDDVSEIFQIREYIPGDRMQRVHWKMSMKQDSLLVKDYAAPLKNRLTLVLNLDCKSTSDYTALVTLVGSLSVALVCENIRHTIMWFSEDSQKEIVHKVKGDSSIFMMMNELLTTSFAKKDRTHAMLKSERGTINAEQVFFVTNYLNEMLLEAFLGIRDTHHKKMIVLSNESIEKYAAYEVLQINTENIIEEIKNIVFEIH